MREIAVKNQVPRGAVKYARVSGKKARQRFLVKEKALTKEIQLDNVVVLLK